MPGNQALNLRMGIPCVFIFQLFLTFFSCYKKTFRSVQIRNYHVLSIIT